MFIKDITLENSKTVIVPRLYYACMHKYKPSSGITRDWQTMKKIKHNLFKRLIYKSSSNLRSLSSYFMQDIIKHVMKDF